MDELLKEKRQLEYLINNKKNEIIISKGEERQTKENELKELKKELEEIKEKIINITPRATSDDLIELIEIEKGIYLIRLNVTKMIVGIIKYRGYHYSMMLGDISYEIYEPFRGNNYAYKALCLLSELLYNNNIDDFWITAYTDNIPSNKIIQKFNGEFIQKVGDLNLYNCCTKLENKRNR